jgi:hypothetical protein
MFSDGFRPCAGHPLNKVVKAGGILNLKGISNINKSFFENGDQNARLFLKQDIVKANLLKILPAVNVLFHLHRQIKKIKYY